MNLTLAIGNTPLIYLKNLSKKLNVKIYAKCEFLNPLGSIKDRAAYFMIKEANQKDLYKYGIIEPTSGNTGIALAGLCASLNINLTLTMPESMSIERVALLKHLGANLILTPASEGMKGAINRAKELQKEGKILLDQFSNPANPKAHYQTTAPEIYKELKEIDIFINGVGTGGTISGVGKFLKEKVKNIKIFAVEPSKAAAISKKEISSHQIQGIGAGFIPKNLDLNLLDDVVLVDDEMAFQAAREVAKIDGLFVGISSGANIAAIKKIASKYSNKTFLTTFADDALKYQSTPLFKK